MLQAYLCPTLDSLLLVLQEMSKSVLYMLII